MIIRNIILTCQLKMQDDRSISAVYYVLQGKKSIQSIQDAQLYHLTAFYSIYKDLSKQRFEELIEQYVEEQMLNPLGENKFVVTDKGRKWLLQNPLSMDYINGERFKQIDHIFYSRLQLLVQVWTNHKKNNNTYLPIVEQSDILHWMKTYYSYTKNNIINNLRVLYQELVAILSKLPREDPPIFIEQLTSEGKIGLTIEQISFKTGLSVEDIYLKTVNIIHLMLQTVKKDQEKYQILSSIANDLVIQSTITHSAEQTNNLLNKGYSLKEIANIRSLKINTIYDHVVEIALHDDYFPLSQYVSPSHQQEIVHVIERNQSYKLKTIKAEVSEEISYFQIRLVLTKMNNCLHGVVHG
ncbi:MAG TPA: helix-turn-helix domain-containing protein [Pseudogracilibacillus sp.]|nr:helix-turn-helix domain-containing protein [Pseudogracilibacillus sp.]